jgi:hypothetical protein
MRTRIAASFSGQWLRKSAFLVVTWVIFAVVGQHQGLSQAITGDIVGTVTDSTGAVVPNASVIITNAGTEEKRQARSGAAGEYAFSVLQPGSYTLVADAQGFKTYKLSSFNVGASDRVRLDIPLQLGASSETVEVHSDSLPAVQADSSEQPSPRLRTKTRDSFNWL